MADSKLDQALGEIIQNERENGPRRNQQRRFTAAPKAPAGGIQKTRAQPHRRVASQPARSSSWKNEKGNKVSSKILVSNLPYDVTEDMIKDYFNETVGDVSSVEIHYGPDGRSRGKADVLFSKEESASIAFAKLDKLPIDNRPIQIEIIGAKPEPVKSLAERAGQPKKERAQPKSAADIKDKSGKGQQAKGKAGGVKKNPPRRGAARNVRPAKKTAEELDLEMADYFDQADPNGNPEGQGEGEAAPAAGGNDDAAMDDEIS
jgi:THO complex subunit 4